MGNEQSSEPPALITKAMVRESLKRGDKKATKKLLKQLDHQESLLKEHEKTQAVAGKMRLQIKEAKASRDMKKLQRCLQRYDKLMVKLKNQEKGLPKQYQEELEKHAPTWKKRDSASAKVHDKALAEKRKSQSLGTHFHLFAAEPAPAPAPPPPPAPEPVVEEEEEEKDDDGDFDDDFDDMGGAPVSAELLAEEARLVEELAKRRAEAAAAEHGLSALNNVVVKEQAEVEEAHESVNALTEQAHKLHAAIEGLHAQDVPNHSALLATQKETEHMLALLLVAEKQSEDNKRALNLSAAQGSIAGDAREELKKQIVEQAAMHEELRRHIKEQRVLAEAARASVIKARAKHELVQESVAAGIAALEKHVDIHEAEEAQLKEDIAALEAEKAEVEDGLAALSAGMKNKEAELQDAVEVEEMTTKLNEQLRVAMIEARRARQLTSELQVELEHEHMDLDHLQRETAHDKDRVVAETERAQSQLDLIVRLRSEATLSLAEDGQKLERMHELLRQLAAKEVKFSKLKEEERMVQHELEATDEKRRADMVSALQQSRVIASDLVAKVKLVKTSLDADRANASKLRKALDESNAQRAAVAAELARLRDELVVHSMASEVKASELQRLRDGIVAHEAAEATHARDARGSFCRLWNVRHRILAKRTRASILIATLARGQRLRLKHMQAVNQQERKAQKRASDREAESRNLATLLGGNGSLVINWRRHVSLRPPLHTHTHMHHMHMHMDDEKKGNGGTDGGEDAAPKEVPFDRSVLGSLDGIACHIRASLALTRARTRDDGVGLTSMLEDLRSLQLASHPNLVRLFGVAMHPTTRRLCFVSAHLGTRTESLSGLLSRCVRDGATVPRATRLAWALGIASGMHYLDRLHMVHLSLSTHSVLLAPTPVAGEKEHGERDRDHHPDHHPDPRLSPSRRVVLADWGQALDRGSPEAGLDSFDLEDLLVATTKAKEEEVAEEEEEEQQQQQQWDDEEASDKQGWSEEKDHHHHHHHHPHPEHRAHPRRPRSQSPRRRLTSESRTSWSTLVRERLLPDTTARRKRRWEQQRYTNRCTKQHNARGHAFMSPEQLSLPDEAVISRPSKADVFSFGLVLWCMDGRHPFGPMVQKSDDDRAAFYNKGFRPPIAHDSPVAAVIRQCWARKPNDRPKFRAIKTELTRLVDLGPDHHYGINTMVSPDGKSLVITDNRQHTARRVNFRTGSVRDLLGTSTQADDRQTALWDIKDADADATESGQGGWLPRPGGIRSQANLDGNVNVGRLSSTLDMAVGSLERLAAAKSLASDSDAEAYLFDKFATLATGVLPTETGNAEDSKMHRKGGESTKSTRTNARPLPLPPLPHFRAGFEAQVAEDLEAMSQDSLALGRSGWVSLRKLDVEQQQQQQHEPMDSGSDSDSAAAPGPVPWAAKAARKPTPWSIGLDSASASDDADGQGFTANDLQAALVSSRTTDLEALDLLGSALKASKAKERSLRRVSGMSTAVAAPQSERLRLDPVDPEREIRMEAERRTSREAGHDGHSHGRVLTQRSQIMLDHILTTYTRTSTAAADGTRQSASSRLRIRGRPGSTTVRKRDRPLTRRSQAAREIKNDDILHHRMWKDVSERRMGMTKGMQALDAFHEFRLRGRRLPAVEKQHNKHKEDFPTRQFVPRVY